MYILLTNIQSVELVQLYWTNLKTVCQQDNVKLQKFCFKLFILLVSNKRLINIR